MQFKDSHDIMDLLVSIFGTYVTIGGLVDLVNGVVAIAVGVATFFYIRARTKKIEKGDEDA